MFIPVSALVQLAFRAGAVTALRLALGYLKGYRRVANLARHLKVDPETALRAANAKFVRRFRSIEAGLAARGKAPAEASLEEMEALWVEAKRSEK